MKKSTFRTGHRKSFAPKPLVNTRESTPRAQQTPKGMKLLCPFCVPPHELIPGQQANCGTIVKLSAVQTTIPARTVRDKGLICTKCGEGGGIMVPFYGQYIHLNDCKPGTTVVAPDAYQYSKLAERVFNMKPGLIKRWYEKRNGRAEAVKEIDPQTRERTGKILGYVFMKV